MESSEGGAVSVGMAGDHRGCKEQREAPCLFSLAPKGVGNASPPAEPARAADTTFSVVKEGSSEQKERASQASISRKHLPQPILASYPLITFVITTLVY